MNHSLRTLVRELILTEAQKKQLRLQWKFDPTVFEEPFDPVRWGKMWSGVEKFYGQYFVISCRIAPHSSPSQYVDVKLVAIATKDTRFYVDVTNTVDREPSLDQIKRLSSAADDLRGDIEHGFAKMDWIDRFEAIEKFDDQLPPWRKGIWFVPGVGEIKGDRLDLGLFQIVVPLDLKNVQYAYLITRPDFATSGSSPQAWRWLIFGHYIPQMAQKEIERWIMDNFNLDNHDPDYLAKIFASCPKTGKPLG